MLNLIYLNLSGTVLRQSLNPFVWLVINIFVTNVFIRSLIDSKTWFWFLLLKVKDCLIFLLERKSTISFELKMGSLSKWIMVGLFPLFWENNLSYNSILWLGKLNFHHLYV